MSNNIYDKYNVNISYLKRDYLKNPLNITINGKGSEKPFKQDLEYLYITLNIRKDELIDYFSCSISTFNRWLKFYNIQKPLKSILKCIKETNLKKYGVENPFQSNIIKDKIKETNLKKYGVEHYTQTDEYKNYMNNYFKNDYQNILRLKKIKETNLKKYGVSSNLKLTSIKNQIKETNLKKYGVEYYTQSDNYKFKTKETNLKKYGVEYYTQTDEYKKYMKNEDIQTIRKTKEHISKILNNSYGKSKDEDLIYIKLMKYFKDVKRQYKSKQYPFACDFYIPSKDLYIEYQGYWTHGKEPYIGSIEQLEKVKLWESKNTKHYNNAINVWTIRDPLKRKTAKDNGLNWIEFFNMNDFEHWLN